MICGVHKSNFFDAQSYGNGILAKIMMGIGTLLFLKVVFQTHEMFTNIFLEMANSFLG